LRRNFTVARIFLRGMEKKVSYFAGA